MPIYRKSQCRYFFGFNRCGVIQEGDRIIAINGQYLEGRTMDEIYGFIAESPVKMLLTVEFRVAGIEKLITLYLTYFVWYFVIWFM